jgi:hypothetical protein
MVVANLVMQAILYHLDCKIFPTRYKAQLNLPLYESYHMQGNEVVQLLVFSLVGGGVVFEGTIGGATQPIGFWDLPMVVGIP